MLHICFLELAFFDLAPAKGDKIGHIDMEVRAIFIDVEVICFCEQILPTLLPRSAMNVW
jgi:hypothetical protein